ncbi:MAG TPA: FAD-dependent oxidoreductase, partial [Acidimicrobiales bacterium]|nr:FAD-dependent oxidoreductase [Acidimicrobiales bacterium]
MRDDQTEPIPPLRVRDVASWDDEADVVVVGLGCAGTCAAIEASEAGAEVLALERAGAPGGTSA